jgi:ubiquinone/menaquinone biosynthesis C-methylase UbiE
MRATESGVDGARRAPETDINTSSTHFGIHLQCPRCKTGIPEFECLHCGFALRDVQEILYALPPERVAHYARFIEEYERIRDAEGRGSESDDFYLGLPYTDNSRKNSHQWHIRARTFDFLLHHVLKPRFPAGGRILDLGAGNCWMSYRLALAGFNPFAIDLLTNDRDGLGAAVRYRNYLPVFFARCRAELVRLPFQDAQFDAAVFNASFHYAEDYEATLREALRCIRKGGVVIISDTPWYSTDMSGKRMISERQANFLQRYGTASASIESLEYLTDQRLSALKKRLSIHWTIYSPGYGLKWAMRPILAKLLNRREPSRFRLYVVQKATG